MSQGPVPPRYPPHFPQQPQVPQPYPQQPGAPMAAAYPQTQQEGYLVNVPSQAPAPAYPQSAQPINYYSATQQHSGGIWRLGDTLVMHKQAQLPPQCIKCCTPIEGQPLKRSLSWHPSWVYLLILPGILIYAIVAMAISEKATVYVPLCEKHLAKRRMHLWIATGIFLASIGCFFLAAYVPRGQETIWILIGFFGILASLIYAVINGRLVVTPDKIDAQYVWLKGVSPQFLDQFPSMTQQY